MGSFCNQRQRRYATLYQYVSTVQIGIAHGELSSTSQWIWILH